MEKRIFLDTVIVRSGDFYLKALFGIETRNSIEVGGGVFVSNEKTTFLSDKAIYFKDEGKLVGMGNVVLSKENMNLSGDTIYYFPDGDTGFINGHFFFGTESLVVNGKDGFISSDSVVVGEKPITIIDSTRILSDTLIYVFSDSIGIFRNNVEVVSRGVKGICNKLLYFRKNSLGKVYNSPVFFTQRDSVIGDSGYVFFRQKMATVFNGKILSKLKDGENTVKGEFVHFYYSSGEIDSVAITGNPEGEYTACETEGDKP